MQPDFMLPGVIYTAFKSSSFFPLQVVLPLRTFKLHISLVESVFANVRYTLCFQRSLDRLRFQIVDNNVQCVLLMLS